MWTKLLQSLRQPRDNPCPAAPPAPGDEPRGACGWFDSSHDLSHGLSVRELAEPATLARELPLPAWIDWQLAACTATHPAARA